MDRLWQDLRFALRMLVKSPGFSAVAILVLALGIGANATIFTLLNSILLRPIEAHAPEELVAVYSRDVQRPDTYRAFSYPNFQDIRELNTTFSSVFAHDLTTVGVGDELGVVTRRVLAEIVSADYFDTFGVSPFRGRFFSAAEEVPGSAMPVAVVSHEHWRRSGADPDLVGSTLRVNGRALTIVGIAPRRFTGRTALLSPQLYLPLGMHHLLLNDMFIGDDSAALTDRAAHRLLIVGRLLPGLSANDAEARLAALWARLEESFPAVNADQQLVVGPLERLGVSTSPNDGSELGALPALLLGMTGVILLIACLNLANMLLARGAARRREFAIRAAIGGGRSRILRQLLTEGLVLSLLGGVVALTVAAWVNRLLATSMNNLLALAGFALDIVVHSAPDIRVLLATAGFAVLGTLMFGLGPAWRLSRTDVMAELKDQGGDRPLLGARSGGRRRRGGFLVVCQIALSVVLLVAAGLFVRGAMAAASVDLGFPIDGGLLVEIDPGLNGYDESRTKDIYTRVLDRLRALPEIEAVGLAATVPLGSVSAGARVRRAEDLPGAGRDGGDEIETIGATSNIVGEDYFTAVGLPVLRGRGFTQAESESDEGQPVAIIDELLAAWLWPDEDPIGRHVGFGRNRADDEVEVEVVGVVGSVRDDLFPSELRPHVYRPFGQRFQTGMLIHLRTAAPGDAASALLPAIRREIQAVDPQLPIVQLRTLRAHVDESASLWVVSVGAKIFAAFGVIALLLAVVGVYAVKAYTVSRRTREIGIRKSLGATSGATLRLILREGLSLTVGGLVVGLVLAAGVARLLSSLLYEVSAFDPLAFIAAPVILAAASLIATFIPARRASRVAPLVALRQD